MAGLFYYNSVYNQYKNEFKAVFVKIKIRLYYGRPDIKITVNKLIRVLFSKIS